MVPANLAGPRPPRQRTDGARCCFADSCLFPDHPRRRASEHFINLPRDAKGLTSDQCPQADKCVLTAILADSKVLASNAETDADRLIALKSVERNGLNIKAVDIAEFAKIVKIVEPATDMTGARFAFGIFIYQ